MIKVIIFDFGGVISVTKSEEAGLLGLCNKFSKILKVSEYNIYDVYKKYWDNWKLGNLSINQVYANLLRDLNVDYDKEELIQLTFNYASLNDEVYALIKSLKKHYKLACLTNHVKEWFENEVKRFNLKPLFNIIFTSYDLKLAKPNPEIYKAVLKKLKIQPEECLFIDDLERNTIPAAELGIKTIVFKSYSQLKNDLIKIGIKGA